jgi:hypothetical protein
MVRRLKAHTEMWRSAMMAIPDMMKRRGEKLYGTRI